VKLKDGMKINENTLRTIIVLEGSFDDGMRLDNWLFTLNGKEWTYKPSEGVIKEKINKQQKPKSKQQKSN
jgi:hypothetical protein